MSKKEIEKDPMVFGNAMIEYKNGKPLNMRRSSFKPAYNPDPVDLGFISNANEDGKPLFELEDDE